MFNTAAQNERLSITNHNNERVQVNTPSVPNYKSFQKSWRVKLSQSLTKIIERNINIYDIKYVHYENIANKETNDT